jgi:hypothetical protein
MAINVELLAVLLGVVVWLSTFALLRAREVR